MTEDQLKAFTPTERKILAVLADGERHLRMEFYSPLDIIVLEGGSDSILSVHVGNIRAKLRSMGKWILTESEARKSYYRLVTLTRPLLPIS